MSTPNRAAPGGGSSIKSPRRSHGPGVRAGAEEEAARIAVLDYGMGNLRSVEKALEQVGAEAEITAEADRARHADGLILPGVGAFPAAMRRVRELGFDRLAHEWAEADRPLLGICLGMQLLFESSTENEGADGLGLLPGTVTELDAPGLKVPHIGWEPVRWERSLELTEGIPDGTPFYFVHSFAARPVDADVVGLAEWGERFASAVARGRTWAVQFHPEKSSAAGLRLLGNFVEFVRAAGSGGVAERPGGAVTA
jgi:glutamine amidotransferase